MSSPIALLFLVALLATTVRAANTDLNFDMTGFTKQTALLVTSSCTSPKSAKEQINVALGGSKSVDCVEEPTTNSNKHVSCVDDSRMGKVINFTLYKNDNDPVTKKSDRQRLEMKVFENSPDNLKAKLNSHFVYAYWFKFKPSITLGTGFFHILQLKAVDTAENEPVVALSLSTSDGFHLRIRNDDFKTISRKTLLPINAFTGKWIQVRLEVLYKQGKTPDSNNSGYVKVILKDQNGSQVYPTGSQTGKFYGNMFWKDANFVRPKWGLYRERSSKFQPSDWQLFQNIQIWSKK